MVRTFIIACGALLLLAPPAPAAARALRVVATTPDLGSLARDVGGDAVDVTVLVKGPQDPHFVEARPSFVQKLHRADLLVFVGMELEIGWLPTLLRQARNAEIRPGGRGYLDASRVIEPLEVPDATVDRSMGDVHRLGNPHYLTDPINGLRVAAALRDALTELRPAEAERFRAGYADFARRLMGAMVGEALVERHAPESLAARVAAGDLSAFLEREGDADVLGGWLGATTGQRGDAAVQDHRMWPYFADRFGLNLIETLEPKPGIAPTTRHLSLVIERAKAEDVKFILSSPYFDPRHARFVAAKTGARLLEMAHQPGARPDTGDYIATLDYNVRQLTGGS